nr:MAG TPA: hypothetical protein [Caudoviricetes sp.]
MNNYIIFFFFTKSGQSFCFLMFQTFRHISAA